MRFLLFVAAAIVGCQASVFVNAPSGKGCKYPNWKCDCKVVYNCDGSATFPTNFDDPKVAGYVKDLAPDDYQLRIPGKRWRREIWSQEEFCKRECNDRLNAFLCLEDGGASAYSDAAICIKLLDLNPGPFTLDGTPQPCCEIYLQWGLNWCPDKWWKPVTNVLCLSRGALDDSFPVSTGYVFGVEGGCDPAADSTLTWCTGNPTCPAA